MEENILHELVDKKLNEIMTVTGCTIGQCTFNNVKEIISDNIINNIKNELSSVIKIKTTLGVMPIQTNRVSDNIMKTLLLRALELKIKESLNDSIEEIIYKYNLDITPAAIDRDINGNITNVAFCCNIPSDVAIYLNDNDCDFIDYLIIEGSSAVYLDQYAFFDYDIYYKYFKNIKNYKKKAALLGNNQNYMDRVIDEHALKMCVNEPSGSIVEYNILTLGHLETFCMHCVIVKVDDTKNLNNINVNNLIRLGKTLDESIDIINKGLYERYCLDNSNDNIESICEKYDISTYNLILKLSQNIKLDRAIQECVEYKEKYCDYFTSYNGMHFEYINDRVENRRKIAIKAIRDIIKENKLKSEANNVR